jgi:hypothetical protein
MAKIQQWQDDDWLLLMQLYLKKPVGIKPMYSKAAIELCLELHIPPQIVYQKMCAIANLETPRIERIWNEYAQNPRRLSRAVKLLRQMKAFGNDDFYEGVDIQETFETDFRPIAPDTIITPIMLIIILDLYFRLTPITMVVETPEIQDLSRLLKLPAQDIVDIMHIYQQCDPYLKPHPRPLSFREGSLESITSACQAQWRQYGNGDPTALAEYASKLKEYYKN